MKELPEDIQQKIIAYIDGDLPADEAAALEVYLVNTDPGISEMVIGMMADRQSISVLPKVSAPKDLAGNIMEQLERSSLLHGVEQDLQRARKPWWQTRAAIAAGVMLFVGGFSAIIISTVHRDRNPAEGGSGPVAVTDMHKAGSPDARAMHNGKAGLGPELDINSTERLNTVAAAPSVNKTKGGAPAWLIVDTRETIEDKLNKIPLTVDHPIANGYLEAPTPQDALMNVSAGTEDALAGPPVVVYIQARDQADADRLERRLAEFMHEADFAPAERGDLEKDAAIAAKDADKGIVPGTAPMQFSISGGTLAGNVSGGTFQLNPSAPGITGLNPTSGVTITNNSTITNNGAGTGAITITGNGGVTIGNSSTVSANNTQANEPQNPASIFNQVGKGDYNNPGVASNNDLNIGNSELNKLSQTNPAGGQYGQIAGNTVFNNKGNLVGANTYGSTNNINAGIALNNASQAKNLHNGAGRGAGGSGNTTNFDNTVGQYAATNYREYNRQVGNTEQQNVRAQQDMRLQENQKARDSMQDSNFVGDAGQPYRVYLSPEQLEQVTTEFRVRSINRGQVTYVIPDSPAQAHGAQSQVAGMKDAELTKREKEKELAATPAKPGAVAAPSPVIAATRAAATPVAPAPAPSTLAETPKSSVVEANRKGGAGVIVPEKKAVEESVEGTAQSGGEQTPGNQPGAQQQNAGAGAGGGGGRGGFGGGNFGGKAPAGPAAEAEALAAKQQAAKQELAAGKESAEQSLRMEKAKVEAGDDSRGRSQGQRLEVIISIQTPADRAGKAASPNAAERESKSMGQ
jgi:hypothetical protein